MMTRREISGGLLMAIAAVTPAVAATAEIKPIPLPPARQQGGMPLMNALMLRRSTREYSDRPLALQTLSDLLWAAFGINRPSGDRTAPYHFLVIDIYVVLSDGVWTYEPKTHSLQPCQSGDFRAATGLQDFVTQAAVNLVYVAHGERMKDVSPEDARLFASADASFIGQNVYLFCASEGLGSVFRGAVDRIKLAEMLNLPAQQFVAFAQTVGYARS
jgi:nitroreductase